MLVRKKNPSLAALVCIYLISPPLCALKESRLWLPKTQQYHYIGLLKAAKAAESLKRCIEVLDGTIDLVRSDQDNPVFRILCRQENGLSYNEMVDGVTLETLTTQENDEEESGPTEEEIAERKRGFWLLCREHIKSELTLMQGMQWLKSDYFEPDSFSGFKAVFTFDFDAEDVYKTPLRYSSTCFVDYSNEAPTIKIDTRVRRSDAN